MQLEKQAWLTHELKRIRKRFHYSDKAELAREQCVNCQDCVCVYGVYDIPRYPIVCILYLVTSGHPFRPSHLTPRPHSRSHNVERTRALPFPPSRILIFRRVHIKRRRLIPIPRAQSAQIPTAHLTLQEQRAVAVRSGDPPKTIAKEALDATTRGVGERVVGVAGATAIRD